MSECWLEGRRWCFGGHKVWGRLSWVSCVCVGVGLRLGSSA